MNTQTKVRIGILVLSFAVPAVIAVMSIHAGQLMPSRLDPIGGGLP